MRKDIYRLRLPNQAYITASSLRSRESSSFHACPGSRPDRVNLPIGGRAGAGRGKPDGGGHAPHLAGAVRPALRAWGAPGRGDVPVPLDGEAAAFQEEAGPWRTERLSTWLSRFWDAGWRVQRAGLPDGGTGVIPIREACDEFLSRRKKDQLRNYP